MKPTKEAIAIVIAAVFLGVSIMIASKINSNVPAPGNVQVIDSTARKAESPREIEAKHVEFNGFQSSPIYDGSFTVIIDDRQVSVSGISESGADVNITVSLGADKSVIVSENEETGSLFN